MSNRKFYFLILLAPLVLFLLLVTGCTAYVGPSSDGEGGQIEVVPATPLESAFAKTLNLEIGSPEFAAAWAEGEQICEHAKTAESMEDMYYLPYSPILIGAALGAICPAEMPPAAVYTAPPAVVVP